MIIKLSDYLPDLGTGTRDLDLVRKWLRGYGRLLRKLKQLKEAGHEVHGFKDGDELFLCQIAQKFCTVLGRHSRRKSHGMLDLRREAVDSDRGEGNHPAAGR